MQISQQGQRLAFDNAANLMKRAGVNPGRAILSQSYLRTEIAMSTSATTYKFDVVTNDNLNTNYATMQKLNLQDAFIVSQIGFFLFVPPTSATTTTAIPLSYPTVGNFSGAAGNFTAAQAIDALSIYNGSLTLNVNQTTILTGWDLSRHYRVPTIQQNAATAIQVGAATAFTAPAHLPFDSLDLSNDGFYPCEPNIVLNGAKKNDLQISIPSAPATVPTNGRMVLIFRGILAQNVTTIN